MRKKAQTYAGKRPHNVGGVAGEGGQAAGEGLFVAAG